MCLWLKNLLSPTLQHECINHVKLTNFSPNLKLQVCASQFGSTRLHDPATDTATFLEQQNNLKFKQTI